MNLAGRLLILGGSLLILASCGADKRDATRKKLHQVGSQSLRREAALLYKELFVTSASKYFLPKADAWPMTFRRFDPLLVRAYPDGFSLVLNDERGTEEGLYIVPLGMDNHPREGRNSSFQKLEDGIYWYSFSGK